MIGLRVVIYEIYIIPNHVPINGDFDPKGEGHSTLAGFIGMKTH